MRKVLGSPQCVDPGPFLCNCLPEGAEKGEDCLNGKLVYQTGHINCETLLHADLVAHPHACMGVSREFARIIMNLTEEEPFP